MASGCDPCNKSTPKNYAPPSNYSNCGGGCGVDSTCVTYTGPNLNCLDVGSGENLEEILYKVNAVVCTSQGDYSEYNFHCLTDTYVIENEAEFVSAITEYACNLNTAFVNYSTVTVPGIITNIQNQINEIVNPSLALCSYTGVIPTDSLDDILVKFGGKLCDLDSRLNLSSVNWAQCYTVPTTPTTLTEAFNLLVDQICQASQTGGGATLPTFNNQGSCLPAPLGTADSLVLTINKIKERLCDTGVYDIDDSPWGCVTNPAPLTGSNIQAAFDKVLGAVNGLVSNRYTFNPNQFILNQTVPGDACSGFEVTLDPSIGIEDRLVAASPSDSSPGTLIEKLVAGTNITLDNSNPEEIVLNATFTPGVTYDPNLVSWNECSPCEVEIPIPTTLEESFQYLKDEICCLTDIVINPDTGLKVYYVDGNNPNPGDGSILNPFNTLDAAYNKVVGTGTAKVPQNTGITIKVAAYNYTTNLNLFASTTSWDFDTGAVVTYTGTDYLFDTLDTVDYTDFKVSGKWSFDTVDGGLLWHRTPTAESRVFIEIDSTNQTMDTEDPMAKPLIRVESNYGLAQWVRSRLDLAVHGRLRSTDNHVIVVNGYTEVYVRGLTTYARVDAGDGFPSSIVPDQRALYYNNQDPNITNHMYSQQIKFDSIQVGSDGTSAVFIQGYYGNIDFYNVSFDSLQAVNNFQSSSIEVGNLTKASYSGKTRGFTIRNCKFADNIYSGTLPIYPIVSVGTPGVNGISIINSLIPDPYLVDPDLVINEDLGVMANTISNFNIRNVPEFEDITAAQSAGLVEGDLFKTPSNQLMIV